MVPRKAHGSIRGTARPALARLVPFALLALFITPQAFAQHDHSGCRDEPVGEYVTRGEVGEYITGEIPEYVTGEIPEYITGEIPEYRPHADGDYIGEDFPPHVLATRYVEIRPGVFVLVRGVGSRARARQARLIASFEGDKLITYLTHGFPPNRHRENDQDIVTEHWTYPEEDTTFIFCGSQLIRTQYF